MKRQYDKNPKKASAKTIRRLIAGATESARHTIPQERQREITVRPGSKGWTAMEFTDGGGSWLATDASYDRAVCEAIAFLADVIASGAQPSIEIIVGHPRCYAPGLRRGE